MRRTLYTDDHEQYRATVRELLAREVAPRFLDWESERRIDREVSRTAFGRAVGDFQHSRIYGGTTEIMKEIIGRDIAGRARP